MSSNPTSIILPLPLEAHLLEPAEIWDKHVRSRRVIYFDTTIWISLTEGKSDDARVCLSLCREAVQRELVIFPLSFGSIGELLRQPQQAPKEIQAGIMEELSEGVTFRSAESIQAAEAQAAVRFLCSNVHSPVDRSVLFTYVVEYGGDLIVKFPAGITLAHMKATLEALRSASELRSIASVLGDADSLSDDSIGERFVASMTESIKRKEEILRPRGQFNTASMRDIERSSLITCAVIPAFRNMVLEDCSADDIAAAYRKVDKFVDDFARRHGKGGRRLMAKIFNLLPATELLAQLMAARGMNPSRAVRTQDFWDIEHAKTSGSYSDAFATL